MNAETQELMDKIAALKAEKKRVTTKFSKQIYDLEKALARAIRKSIKEQAKGPKPPEEKPDKKVRTKNKKAAKKAVKKKKEKTLEKKPVEKKPKVEKKEPEKRSYVQEDELIEKLGYSPNFMELGKNGKLAKVSFQNITDGMIVLMCDLDNRPISQYMFVEKIAKSEEGFRRLIVIPDEEEEK